MIKGLEKLRRHLSVKYYHGELDKEQNVVKVYSETYYHKEIKFIDTLIAYLSADKDVGEAKCKDCPLELECDCAEGFRLKIAGVLVIKQWKYLMSKEIEGKFKAKDIAKKLSNTLLEYKSDNAKLKKELEELHRKIGECEKCEMFRKTQEESR